MGFKKYKINQISLVPDKYGQHLKIEKITEIEDDKYTKHIKINENTVKMLEDGFFIPSRQEEIESE